MSFFAARAAPVTGGALFEQHGDLVFQIPGIEVQ
jgi:hypothetical protein